MQLNEGSHNQHFQTYDERKQNAKPLTT